MQFFKTVAITVIFLTLFAACGGDEAELQTFKVRTGEFIIDVVETGELNAKSSVNISSPALPWHFGKLKITDILEDGDDVVAGDTVILFDPSEVEKSKLNAQAELEIANAELKKLKAEQASRIQELEVNLEINNLTYQIAEIELEQATFEAEVKRKEIQLNLEKTKIALSKAKKEIENQKKIHEQEIMQSLIKIRQLKSKVTEANETIEKLIVTSPANGLAIISRNWSTRNKWQVGDQPWSGTPIIALPDLSQIQVDAEINEVDIAKIEMGQKAEIKLDAFTNSAYTGTVLNIATLAKFKDEENSSIKIFPVTILLDSTSSELMPGMTVSCQIVVDKIQDVMYIPNEALHKKGMVNYVYLKSGKGYKRQDVETGLTNNDYVIIEKGLKNNDEVALSIPPEYSEQEAGKV